MGWGWYNQDSGVYNPDTPPMFQPKSPDFPPDSQQAKSPQDQGIKELQLPKIGEFRIPINEFEWLLRKGLNIKSVMLI